MLKKPSDAFKPTAALKVVVKCLIKTADAKKRMKSEKTADKKKINQPEKKYQMLKKSSFAG